MKFCVVGGLNLDVSGHCEGVPREKDSNIGRIRFSAGGVGHNIACALKKRGHEVSLITVLSRDLFGEYLRRQCMAEGLDIAASIVTDASTPAYMAAHASDGDMLIAVNDMPALKLLTPREIAARASYINSFDALITEANLEAETLRALGENTRIPMIADAVSAAKCARLNWMLPYLTALKLNLAEAQTLSGEALPKDAGQALFRRGVRRVLVSLGAEGVYACDADSDAFLRPESRFTCQTNGAGDAMCAGLAEGAAQGLNAVKCAGLGMSCAAALLRERENGAR